MVTFPSVHQEPTVIDPDDLMLIFLLLLVVVALLIPPGPGTPLRSPVATQ